MAYEMIRHVMFGYLISWWALVVKANHTGWNYEGMSHMLWQLAPHFTAVNDIHQEW